MSMLTEEQARVRFEPIAPALCAVVKKAWADWMGTPYPATWRCRRTRANFLWEQIIGGAHEHFVDHPKLKILRRNESFLFLLDDAIAFRFKKSDEAGITSNIPTQAQWDFQDQQQPLAGLHEVMRVDIVYVLNALETAIDDILVVGKNRGHIEWKFSLLGNSATVALPAPNEPSPGQQNDRVRLVWVKPDPSKLDNDADAK